VRPACLFNFTMVAGGMRSKKPILKLKALLAEDQRPNAPYVRCRVRGLGGTRACCEPPSPGTAAAAPAVGCCAALRQECILNHAFLRCRRQVFGAVSTCGGLGYPVAPPAGHETGRETAPQ